MNTSLDDLIYEFVSGLFGTIGDFLFGLFSFLADIFSGFPE